MIFRNFTSQSINLGLAWLGLFSILICAELLLDTYPFCGGCTPRLLLLLPGLSGAEASSSLHTICLSMKPTIITSVSNAAAHFNTDDLFTISRIRKFIDW